MLRPMRATNTILFQGKLFHINSLYLKHFQDSKRSKNKSKTILSSSIVGTVYNKIIT